MANNKNQNSEANQSNIYLLKCFEDIKCYLMPSPSEEVRISEDCNLQIESNSLVNNDKLI